MGGEVDREHIQRSRQFRVAGREIIGRETKKMMSSERPNDMGTEGWGAAEAAYVSYSPTPGKGCDAISSE